MATMCSKQHLTDWVVKGMECPTWEYCFFSMGPCGLCMSPVGGRRGNFVHAAARLSGQHWCIMLLEQLLRLLPADTYGVSLPARQYMCWLCAA